MRVLALFITALVAALYAKQKAAPAAAQNSGENWEPTSRDFEVVIGEAWEATKKQAVEIFQTVDAAADSAVSEVGAVIAQTFGTKYDSIIVQAAKDNGLEPSLLYKLLYQESRFRDDIITGRVRSPVGALGIAQFMPSTAIEELGSIEAALNPAIAIPGAARYLAKLILSTGSTDAGVAAYNWGIGNVKRKGLASAPKETVNYVSAITGGKIRG